MPYKDDPHNIKRREDRRRWYDRQKTLNEKWNVCTYEVGSQTHEVDDDHPRPAISIERDLELMDLRQQYLCS